MLLACMYCEPKAPILLVLHARTLLLLLPLPTRLCADDTRAILAAVKAASARAAALLAAECGETGCKVGAGRSRAVACRCSGSWGACRPCPWPTLLLPFSACCGLDERKLLARCAICSRLQGGFGNEGRQGVVVLLPAGRYVVTQTIEIKQSNVVVRGEGVSTQLDWRLHSAAAP